MLTLNHRFLTSAPFRFLHSYFVHQALPPGYCKVKNKYMYIPVVTLIYISLIECEVSNVTATKLLYINVKA